VDEQMRHAALLPPSGEVNMTWYVYLAYFIGGAFLANALPHLAAGIAGQPLPSPFASPPFKGLSSPRVNVAWALANLAFAYLLLVRLEPLDLQNVAEASAVFLGFGAMSFQCSRSLARSRK
jgi:hypothetical protein